MKNKGNDLRYDAGPKTKVYSASEFVCRFGLFGFSLLILFFLVPKTEAQDTSVDIDPTSLLVPGSVDYYENSPAPKPPAKTSAVPVKKPQKAQTDNVPADKLSEEFFTVSQSPQNPVSYRLWREDISAPKSADGKNNKTAELQKIIEQISSIELPCKEKIPTTAVIIEAERQPFSEPNQSSEETQTQKVPEAQKPEPKPSFETISERTLQTLEALSQGSGRIGEPFEVAEILFLSGHLKEASVFYQQALTRTDPNQPDLAGTRVWLLLQTGNCLKYTDMQKAAEMYRQLIAEYPDSQWTDVAKANVKLINWYQKQDRKMLKDTNKQ